MQHEGPGSALVRTVILPFPTSVPVQKGMKNRHIFGFGYSQSAPSGGRGSHREGVLATPAKGKCDGSDNAVPNSPPRAFTKCLLASALRGGQNYIVCRGKGQGSGGQVSVSAQHRGLDDQLHSHPGDQRSVWGSGQSPHQACPHSRHTGQWPLVTLCASFWRNKDEQRTSLHPAKHEGVEAGR